MRQALAIAIGLGLVVVALVAVLSPRERRLAVSNSRVVASGVALPVEPGRQRCTRVSFLPQDTSSVRVFAGPFGGPGGPLRVTIADRGRVVSSGTVAGGYGTQPLTIPLRRIERLVVEPQVCLRNLGPRPVQFAGNFTPLSPFASQERGKDVIRYDFYRAGRDSWWQLAPTVAARFSRVKPTFVGAWTLWAVLGVIAALWAASILLLRNESR
jgi:hypothetical protein